MAEQLLLHGDVFKSELQKLSYGMLRMDIGAALLAYSCMYYYNFYASCGCYLWCSLVNINERCKMCGSDNDDDMNNSKCNWVSYLMHCTIFKI